MKITIDRDLVEQALEALGSSLYPQPRQMAAITALRAALAEPTVKESLQVESAFAENATTQQQLEEAPPSDYRRGYWDGFEIGKREGRIEAENALAEPETCTWQQDGDSDSGVYGTSCGHYFDITDGTPEDNKMAWCCYCGKKLAQALITEDEDD